MKRQGLDSNGLPIVVQRRQRNVNWPYLMLAIIVFILVINWPLIFDFTSRQLESNKQAEGVLVKEDARARLREMDEAAGFEKVLDTALRYDREGQRVLAATLFKELLQQAAQNPGYNEQVAALLPRAADFFSRGNEIPKEQVEILYQDAYLAIKQVHGPDYYDYENVHRGLEKHYLAQGRFAEAAAQTRMLLEFYRRYYKDDKEARDALMQPTMARLDHNLLMASEREDAQREYEAALKMTRAKGQPVAAIEDAKKNTDEQGDTVPSSLLEPARMPASMAANISSAASVPLATTSTIDLKTAIESISLDGIHVEQLLDKGDSLTIIGYADDNRAVASYMRLIQRDLAEPKLDWVKSEQRHQQKVSGFSIRLDKVKAGTR